MTEHGNVCRRQGAGGGGGGWGAGGGRGVGWVGVGVKGTRHKQNSLSGNTLFIYMPTYTRSQKKS